MIPSLVGNPKGLWLQVAAACIFQSVPVLILILSIQRYLVRGLMFGAVKG